VRHPGRSALVTLVAIVAVVLTPAVAAACRITNATPWEGTTMVAPGSDTKVIPDTSGRTLFVWFDCGQHCGSYFTIDPGKSVGAPDTGGRVQACVDGAQMHKESGTRLEVDTHGEARIKNGTISHKVGDSDTGVKKGGTLWPDEIVADIGTFKWAIYDADNNLVKSATHGPTLLDGRDANYNDCWYGSP